MDTFQLLHISLRNERPALQHRGVKILFGLKSEVDNLIYNKEDCVSKTILFIFICHIKRRITGKRHENDDDL